MTDSGDYSSANIHGHSGWDGVSLTMDVAVVHKELEDVMQAEF